MKSLLADLDRYWFGFGSPASFGLFRILMGSIIFVSLLMIAPQWDDWFAQSGFVPIESAHLYMAPHVDFFGLDVPRISLIGGVTDSFIAIAFYAGVTLAALFTALGLWTRVSSIALAVGLISLHHRNGVILHGGDTVMRICAIYLAIGPSGAAYSFDHWLAERRAGSRLPFAEVSLWPQRLLAFNVAIIYFTTVWLKYFGTAWRDGTATWYTARLAEFHRFPVPDLLNHPPVTTLTTYGTLLVEFLLATVVFYRPARNPILLAGLGLHAYIEWSMNVPMFAFAICSMYLAFFDGEEVETWVQRMWARFRSIANVRR